MQAGIALRVCGLLVSGLVATSATAGAAIDAARQLEGTAATSLPTVQQQPKTTSQSPATAAVVEGRRLLQRRELEAAQEQYAKAIELAREEGQREIEGAAHRGLASVFSAQTKYADAKSQLMTAVTLLDADDARAELARTYNDLGTTEYFLGDFAAAREHYRRSLLAFEAIGDREEQANLYRNLYFVTEDRATQFELLERGAALATKSGNPKLTGDLLHAWSDALFAGGQLSDSMVKLELAIGFYEEAGDDARRGLSRALTSLGRLHRAHGRLDRAIEAYRRALVIQEAVGDRTGVIQSLNAIASVHTRQKQFREAKRWLDRAFELAQQTQSPIVIDFAAANLAANLIESDEPARGVAMLEELLTHRAANSFYVYHSQLARGYYVLGQYARAIDAAATSISLARETGNVDLLPFTLVVRVEAHKKLGQSAEALAGAREAIALVEQVRAGAIRTDEMKRGFAEQHQQLFTLAIELLYQSGRHREALDAAEQARGRAFADLLAGRDRAGSNVSEAKGSPSAARQDQPPSTVSKPGELQMRGGETGASGVPRLRSANDLESLASVAPLSSSQLGDLAAGLHSTIVSYWVAPDATYVWVIRSSGEIATERIAVPERRLTELVRQTWMTGDAPLRGEATSDQVSTSESSAAADIPQADEAWTPRLRGDGLLSFGDAPVVALGALHQLLVAPIQRLLPAERGSLLTILPHGPLFRLSFAALRNRSGQYLVERYAIHYVPAGVVLDLAEQHARASVARDRRYLLIADPQTPAALPDGKPLPRLPGTRREVSQVSALVPASAATSLVGASATEQRVRLLAGDRSVLHFATHGVIRNDDPLESFLALDTGEAAAGTAPRSALDALDDGRLTAREIYGIHLNADLVVLSACRTGLGTVSGDGVIGLARAFLYAGTPSVVATLWDVADEPAARLMPSLYRSLKRVPDKAQALRRAQLTLLHDLRSGRVSVQTKSGTATLAEHPILWASFILVGKP
jgi:CHAT domain-containing protein/tetratricopeptide (TPR) repeat protein